VYSNSRQIQLFWEKDVMIILIQNGKLCTMHGKAFFGDIRIKHGKIAEIGVGLEHKKHEKVIDASGLWVLPGFIDPHTHLGVGEQGIGFEGNDVNEYSSPITPHLRGIDAYNPEDTAVLESIQAGVTSVAIGPGSANVLGGLFSMIKLRHDSVDTALIKEGVGMKSALGENPKRVGRDSSRMPMTRMGTAAKLREALFLATEYLEKNERYEADPENNEQASFDMKWESLIPVLKKELPLKVHVHRADDILTAIRIAKEFDLKFSLDHCSDGHLITDYIAESGATAIVGPTLGFRTKMETRNKTFETPGILNDAGVRVAITTDHPVVPLRELRICAAYAARYGMGQEEALKAITIYPAEIVGLNDRIGSLESGKDADIVLWSGNPLEVFSEAKLVLIDGKVMFDALSDS